jgi:hypothetical protein
MNVDAQSSSVQVQCPNLRDIKKVCVNDTDCQQDSQKNNCLEL